MRTHSVCAWRDIVNGKKLTPMTFELYDRA